MPPKRWHTKKGKILKSCAMLSLDQEIGICDAVLLEPLTEDNFLTNLQKRFKRDQIYTYIGNILISINPNRKLPLYSADLVETYTKRAPFQLPPHIYGVAESAYRWLNDRGDNQCIIVTGESGAGKTEAARIVLQFLVLVSGNSPAVKIMKDRLVQANTLLEAFGNAKTIKNDNASRFGKFLDIEFDYKGDPIGGHLTHYFVDEWRVTNLASSDRNFHIFYQLLSGADIQLLKYLKLQRNIENYNILHTESNSYTTTESEDRKLFIYTKRAFETLGFTSINIIDIFKVLAVILKLGNLQFVPCNNIDGTDGCSISNDYELFELSELLCTDNKNLQKLLTNRYMENDTLNELSASEATKIKDLLCRSLYTRLFTWLIKKINEFIKARTLGKRKALGILDLWGFEVFENNSFEQLIINYCNEKLHQFITNIVLKEEQEDIVRERLEWIKIEYFDNNIICQLLEQLNYGILTLLQEPHIQTDNDYLTRLEQCCSGHMHFVMEDLNIQNSFKIRHFASPVTYKINGFIEKNKNCLPKEYCLIMFQCKLNIMQELFPEGNPTRCSAKKPIGIADRIQICLNSLLKHLTNRQNHYIRCIKPNEMNQPRIFENGLVQHQIRYMCLLSTVQLCRSGFCYRMSFVPFLQRYKMVCRYTWPKWRGSPIEGVSILLRSLPIPTAEFTFGSSKIFIRSPRTVFELEDFRRRRVSDLALLIQKIWKGYRQRNRYKKLRRSQIIIASAWKDRQKRAQIRQKRKHTKQIECSVKIIQRYYRQWKRRQYLLNLLTNLSPDNDSPLCNYWPSCPNRFTETNKLLRVINHKWRCCKYRSCFDITARNRMREKVTASFLFKDRKCSYPKSVSHPFLGDYVRLRQNMQWKKMSAENNEEYVVFADIINKITRSSGKFVPILLVISTSSMMILDHRTLQIKYRVPAADIYKISLSPFPDDVAVIHVKTYYIRNTETGSSASDAASCIFPNMLDLCNKKGDFIFQTGHIIEIVTKLFLVVQNATEISPIINIHKEFEANFNSQRTIVTFRRGYPDIQPGQIKVVRKTNRMEIFV